MKQEIITIGNVNVKKVAVTAFEYLEGVKITQKSNGKMKNVWALNTSMLSNPLCQTMAKKKGTVCSECYAKQLLSYRPNNHKCFDRNFKVLTERVLEYIPDLDREMVQRNPIFRFEEFGELYNETQALNYLLIAWANPDVSFGWWTKHIDIIDRTLKMSGLSIPENTSIVASSNMLNTVNTAFRKYDFVDHIFTVYTGEYADKHNVETNCAASSCYDCQRCYRKDGDFLINEMLKKDARKRNK